jgi:lysophospholipase L1-like esterase
MQRTTPLFLLGVGIALSASAAGCTHTPHKPALNAADYSGTIRVACVGDSITFGAGVENRGTNCYPVVLGKLLGARYDVRNFGVSGATLLKKGDLSYWKVQQFQELTDFAPQAIILALGTNDSKPQNWKYGNEFADDLRAMLDHCGSLPSHPKIWLCLPPPVYETKWGINEATVGGEIIPQIKQLARERNLPVIDLHEAMSDRPEYFSDKIHPNAVGAGMMAMTIFTALKGR